MPRRPNLPIDPTEDEIKAICREIQTGWSVSQERRARLSNFVGGKITLGGEDEGWSMPIVATSEISCSE